MGWWKQTEIWEGRDPEKVKWIIIVKHHDDPMPGHHAWRVEYGRHNANKRESTHHHTEAEAQQQVEAIRHGLAFDWTRVWPSAT